MAIGLGEVDFEGIEVEYISGIVLHETTTVLE